MDESFKPPKCKPRIKSAPKIRQMYWCRFPEDAQLPEFWKVRPVIILSPNPTLYGSVVIVPCSSAVQMEPKKVVQLETSIDGKASWAVCDKPTTVAVSRLFIGEKGIIRLSEAEFNRVLKLVLELLPKLPNG